MTRVSRKVSRASRRSATHLEGLEGRRLFVAIASYEFAGNSDGHEASESASVVSGVTASLFERGSGFAAPSWANNPNSFVSAPTQSDGKYGTTEGSAVSKGHYYTFSVSPAAEKKVSVTSVTIVPSLQSVPPGAYYNVQFSTNGGTTWLDGVGQHVDQDYTSIEPVTIGVSNLSNITGTINFRLVVWAAADYSLNILGDYSGADITVNGSVGSQAPNAPSALAGTPDIDGVGNILTWTDNSNVETGFAIDRSTSSTFASGVTTFNVGANVTTYTDTTPTVGTKYYYRVRATNSTGSSANTSAAAVRTIHIYETWQQQTWRPEYDGHPEYIRPSSADFDDNIVVSYGFAWGPYGAWEPSIVNGVPNDGVPDVGNYSEDHIEAAVAAAGSTGLLIDDVEDYNFAVNMTQQQVEDATALFIQKHKEFATIARSFDPDVKLGIYSLPNLKFTWYNGSSPDLNAVWAAVTDEMVDELIQPGTYFDFAATPLYLSSDEDYTQQVADMVDRVQYNGGEVIPFFATRTLLTSSNPRRELTSGEIADIADIIADCGYTAIRWDDTIWTSGSASSQAALLAALQAI